MNVLFITQCVDEMQEVLLYFPEVRDISASAQLENLQVIKEIAGKCGYKVRFVASPFNEDKEEVVSNQLISSYHEDFQHSILNCYFHFIFCNHIGKRRSSTTPTPTGESKVTSPRCYGHGSC